MSSKSTSKLDVCVRAVVYKLFYYANERKIKVGGKKNTHGIKEN